MLKQSLRRLFFVPLGTSSRTNWIYSLETATMDDVQVTSAAW